MSNGGFQFVEPVQDTEVLPARHRRLMLVFFHSIMLLAVLDISRHNACYNAPFTL